jgi:sec-independent protein translocase protein TatA
MLNFSLDILGNEWIIIIFVALVLLLGTKRLPEASRKLAKVMAEYNKTKNIVQDEFQKAKGDFNIPVQGPVMSERQKLETMAKSLGIEVKEKSDTELRDLINSRVGGSPKQGPDTSSNQ